MKRGILKLANTIGETGVFRLLYQSSLPVFMLHRVSSSQQSVGGQSMDYIGSCLQYLKKNQYKVFTLSEYFKLREAGERPPIKSCIFTIDDGFIDHHDNAGRIFDFYSYPLNFFLITGFLDKEIWPWDDQITYAIENTVKAKFDLCLPDESVFSVDLANTNKHKAVTNLRNLIKTKDQTNLYRWINESFFKELDVAVPEVAPLRYSSMTWRQARELAQRGHELYPHTHTHRILSTLSPEQQKVEIQTSIDRVKDELRFDPSYFAYPTGRTEDYNTDTIAALKSLNVRKCFNTVPGYVSTKSNSFELPRFSLPSQFDDFKQIITKFEAFKESIR